MEVIIKTRSGHGVFCTQKMPPSIISLSSQWQRHASNDIAVFHMDDKSSLFTLLFLFFSFVASFSSFLSLTFNWSTSWWSVWRWTLVQCSVLWCCLVLCCCVSCWKWENLWDVKQKIEFLRSLLSNSSSSWRQGSPSLYLGLKKKNENNFESFVIGQISRCDESWKKVFRYAETYRINLSHINSNIEFNKTTNSIFCTLHIHQQPSYSCWCQCSVNILPTLISDENVEASESYFLICFNFVECDFPIGK